MRVIVCGAGRVGYGIARRLARENNSVTVIDQSKELVRTVVERLDVRGVVGNGSYPDVLSEAGAREADMLIAVTYSDEVNMIACQIAHALFNVPTKIARIRAGGYLDPRYSDLFSRNQIPIDVIISPEREVSEAIMQRMSTPGAFETKSFVDGKVWAVGVKLRDDCPIVNTPLRQVAELFPDLKITIVAIKRDDHMWRAHAEDQLAGGDEIYFVADRDDVGRALEIMGEAERQARRVILVGGGNIGLYVARGLEKMGAMKIRLIERDRKRAEQIAEELERAVVLQGDGLDRALLREAGVADAETVVAVTDNDQVNILASVVAKREGARRAMALINDQDYGPVAEAVGVDRHIDPRATTISTILQHIRRGRIKGVYSLSDGQAELIDAVALETSPLVNKPLREAHLPEGVMIGAVCRDDKVVMPAGDTVINPGDRVVLMALREHVKDVEQMFRVSLEYF
ncbi:Trk system potassium transporter TrkA [Amphiplicatus metriothermophilus]|uniref:Trk system potassium uptake protein TrkA n=1 Tax=Amphiplicatus metriothermophilus TaxID=1519374 RepID=A0A239PX82_9PROT|nr:Trk system potassium transporter TrkA [Amphiplicatus metriothermophilus]MBB5519964.1 trk system potassium uptake protein TrkA [Amphiplicatus metriothermophilus]SNT74865.1 trk system potassium uptake protein TrkA [Amphiplicatus metriothermophilus]